jgi:hypothetical protein
MTKSEHSYYLMKGVPKNNHSRFFTPAMYDKINTLADKPIEIVMKMKAQEAQHQQEVDLEIIKLLALGKTRRQSEKWNSQMTGQSRKSHESGSESKSSNSEDEKKHRRTNWRDIQECYSCHQVGNIARYCPSTAPGESTAPTLTAAAAAATTMVTT